MYTVISTVINGYKLDGKKGWADGQIGAAGYGKWGDHSYNPGWEDLN